MLALAEGFASEAVPNCKHAKCKNTSRQNIFLAHSLVYYVGQNNMNLLRMDFKKKKKKTKTHHMSLQFGFAM